MKFCVRFLCVALSVQMIFPSHLFATSGEVNRKKEEVSEKFFEALKSDQHKDWEFFDVEGKKLSADDLVDHAPEQFRMRSPKQADGARYGFQIKHEIKESGMVIAMTIKDENFNKVLTRRLVKVDERRSPAENMLKLEQAAKSIESELQKKHAARAKHRAVASRVEGKLLLVVFFGIGTALFLSGVSSLAKNKLSASHFAVMILGLATVFLSVYAGAMLLHQPNAGR